MKDLVNEYVERLPVEVSKMLTLLESNEIEPLRRVAHQLKGSGGGYGFNQITASPPSLIVRSKRGAARAFKN